MRDRLSERALMLAPAGRDAGVALAMLNEANIAGTAFGDANGLVDGLEAGAGFALVTEEALMRVDLHRQIGRAHV